MPFGLTRPHARIGAGEDLGERHPVVDHQEERKVRRRLAALTGRSAALAKPAGASVASDSAAAANVLRRLRHPKYPQVDDRMIEALGSDPCAASHEVRSLNFLHGMLQVSARTARSISAFARDSCRDSASIGKAIAGRVRGFAVCTCFRWLSATIGRSATAPHDARSKCIRVRSCDNFAQLRVRR